MKAPASDSTAERIIAAILAVFFLLFGWLTVLQGGITLKGRSGAMSFVDGWAGLAVALSAFLVAAFGLALLLRTFRLRQRLYFAAMLALFVPPALYVLLRH